MCSTDSKIKAKQLGDRVITYLRLAETCLRRAAEDPDIAHRSLRKLSELMDTEVDVVGSMPKELMLQQISSDVFHIPDGGYTISFVRQKIDAPNRPELWQMESGVYVADLYLAYLRVAIQNEIDLLQRSLYLFDMMPDGMQTASVPAAIPSVQQPKRMRAVHLATSIPYDRMMLIYNKLFEAGRYIHPDTTRGQWNNVCYGGGGSPIPKPIVWIGKGCELRYMVQRYFPNTYKIWESTAQLFLLQSNPTLPSRSINPKTFKNYRISSAAAKMIDNIFATGAKAK